MFDDDVLREVREAKEAYAREHNFDVWAILADLQKKQSSEERKVVKLPPRRPEGWTDAAQTSEAGTTPPAPIAGPLPSGRD